MKTVGIYIAPQARGTKIIGGRIRGFDISVLAQSSDNVIDGLIVEAREVGLQIEGANNTLKGIMVLSSLDNALGAVDRSLFVSELGSVSGKDRDKDAALKVFEAMKRRVPVAEILDSIQASAGYKLTEALVLVVSVAQLVMTVYSRLP